MQLRFVFLKSILVLALSSALSLALVLSVPSLAVTGPQPHANYFRPDIFETFVQYLDIAQLDDGRVVMGTFDGVALFDGEDWQLIEIDEVVVVRAVHPDGDRIYVSGIDKFGYLEPDVFGGFEYVDLTSRFEELLDGDFVGNVWRIYATSAGLVFECDAHLLVWHPETEVA